MKKTIYLTATPERSNNDENNIYQLYFKNIPSIVNSVNVIYIRRINTI